MSLSPLTPTQQKTIVRNLVQACQSIRKLNSTGYKFIHLASGFIAHNNLYGFMDAYSRPGALEDAIRANARFNQWSNFRTGDHGYEYYQTKRMVYNAVLDALDGSR
jgi:S-formylglutathione hydrolase FrmB